LGSVFNLPTSYYSGQQDTCPIPSGLSGYHHLWILYGTIGALARVASLPESCQIFHQQQLRLAMIYPNSNHPLSAIDFSIWYPMKVLEILMRYLKKDYSHLKQCWFLSIWS